MWAPRTELDGASRYLAHPSRRCRRSLLGRFAFFSGCFYRALGDQRTLLTRSDCAEDWRRVPARAEAGYSTKKYHNSFCIQIETGCLSSLAFYYFVRYDQLHN